MIAYIVHYYSIHKKTIQCGHLFHENAFFPNYDCQGYKGEYPQVGSTLQMHVWSKWTLSLESYPC